jgi:hypothetical protein
MVVHDDIEQILCHKFKVGDVVYDGVRPQQLMTIIRRHGLIYYCRLVGNHKKPELAFSERELKMNHTKTE